jgi:hypothetical protein
MNHTIAYIFISTGEQVLELYGMQGGDGEYGTNYHALMLGGVTLSLFLFTYLVLRLRMLQMSH